MNHLTGKKRGRSQHCSARFFATHRTNYRPVMDMTDVNQDQHSDAVGVAPKRQREVSRLAAADIVGLKYFDQLLPLLRRLQDDGCTRDRAGNRKLHYDQYCLLALLFLFNPTCSSLRAIQQASELQNVRRRLGCSRAALGSLSEASTVFDPERLIEIIQELM
jgi:hypothetical protein